MIVVEMPKPNVVCMIKCQECGALLEIDPYHDIRHYRYGISSCGEECFASVCPICRTLYIYPTDECAKWAPWFVKELKERSR
jgi:hypothetical protein